MDGEGTDEIRPRKLEHYLRLSSWDLVLPEFQHIARERSAKGSSCYIDCGLTFDICKCPQSTVAYRSGHFPVGSGNSWRGIDQLPGIGGVVNPAPEYSGTKVGILSWRDRDVSIKELCYLLLRKSHTSQDEVKGVTVAPDIEIIAIIGGQHIHRPGIAVIPTFSLGGNETIGADLVESYSTLRRNRGSRQERCQ
jgi:hypothetical protein